MNGILLRRAACAALLVLSAAVTVTGCSGPPYHRNHADAAACAAFKTSAEQDTALADINAIAAAGNAESADLSDMIVRSYDRYGDQAAPIAWCNAHGYPVVLGQ